MSLFTNEQYDALISNGQPENEDRDHKPVVKLFISNMDCVWLLTKIDPKVPHYAFGLCDTGDGNPKLDIVDLYDLTAVENVLGITVENALDFEGKYPLSAYFAAAKICDRITEKEALLKKCHAFQLMKLQ